MSRPFGLQPADLIEVMDKLGVAEQQVRRDHAISHILAALSRNHAHELIFFGGTALSRTYLRDGRLSEDIDLIATGDRDRIAGALTEDLAAAVARTHGRLSWTPGWSRNSDTEAAVATLPGGLAIRIQLLRHTHYRPWPTQEVAIEQRYRDALPATLRVPTLSAFAAWKAVAWLDRAAARDLYDLWALQKVGALDLASAALFSAHGPTGNVPRSWMFDRSPTAQEWQSQLAGQTRLTLSAGEALAAVRSAWANALGEDWSSVD